MRKSLLVEDFREHQHEFKANVPSYLINLNSYNCPNRLGDECTLSILSVSLTALDES